jgi:hypothetical protein
MDKIVIPLEYKIAHLLRELGFKKETDSYFVKPKGKEPIKFRMNLSNFWYFRHYNFNRYNQFLPSMGEPWWFLDRWNNPIFQQFNESGYLCSAPKIEQILDFCSRKGIVITDEKDDESILKDLITAYRTKSKNNKSFLKYENLHNHTIAVLSEEA